MTDKKLGKLIERYYHLRESYEFNKLNTSLNKATNARQAIIGYVEGEWNNLAALEEK